MEMTEEILETDTAWEEAGIRRERKLSSMIAPATPAVSVTPPPKQKAEIVLVILALLSVVILALTIVVCLPYMQAEKQQAVTEATETEAITLPAQPPAQEEDPQALKNAEEAMEETLPSVEPIIEPEANPYGRLDFQYNRNNYLYCLRQDSYPGVDVSAFQKNIDWQQVKDSGIRFAMLRLGYRGYESGKLVEDEYVQKNLKETLEVGMPIGAYFFSQALTIKEVDEEIEFMLKVLGDPSACHHAAGLSASAQDCAGAAWRYPTRDLRSRDTESEARHLPGRSGAP